MKFNNNYAGPKQIKFWAPSEQKKNRTHHKRLWYSSYVLDILRPGGISTLSHTRTLSLELESSRQCWKFSKRNLSPGNWQFREPRLGITSTPMIFSLIRLHSVLSCLPGHVTRFLMPCGIGMIGSLNRRNVIQRRSTVRWHSVCVFFFGFLYCMPESFQQPKNEISMARKSRRLQRIKWTCWTRLL